MAQYRPPKQNTVKSSSARTMGKGKTKAITAAGHSGKGKARAGHAKHTRRRTGRGKV